MHKNFTEILILFLIVFCLGCEQKPDDLSIMSYNSHRGQDAENRDQLEAMADFIIESGAEIVGLQEVDSVCFRSDQVDQPRILAELTGMHYAFVRHFEFEGGAYG